MSRGSYTHCSSWNFGYSKSVGTEGTSSQSWLVLHGPYERSMRLMVFISEDFYFISHRRELILGLKERGYEVHLATNIDRWGAQISASGVAAYPVDLKRENLSPISVLSGTFQYRHLVSKVRPDVLFAVALKPILSASLLRFLGIRQPILCAFAGLGSAFGEKPRTSIRVARWGLERVFRPLLNHNSCYCLFQNENDAGLFWGRGWTVAARSRVIRGAGIPIQSFRPKTWKRVTKPVLFLFAGRMLWEKGIRQLVDACHMLKERRIPYVCKVAGLIDATSKSSVPIRFIEEQHRSGVLEWLGPRQDVPNLMRDADCFVFPSVYREGVPKVLLEASAAGIPMITTDMPGCRDVVRTEFNGLVVTPGDPVSLAAAMERCIRERDKLPVWGANARRQAEKEYSVEHVIERHIEFLRFIAERHGIESRASVSEG